MSRKAMRLNLTIEQQAGLESLQDREARPYVRERAAALLKIAAGQSGLQVATRGLLKPRD
jgi:hypothetical protein